LAAALFLRNSRKTERGAKQFLSRWRCAPRPLRFLDIAELFEGFLELAGQARAVQAERGKLRDQGLGGGVLGQRFGFEEWDTVDAPGSVGEFVDQLRLGGGGGLVLIEKLLDVALIGLGVLGRQDGGTGSETMAQRVLRRPLLAGFGARAGGVLGVGAVGGGAPFQPALDGVCCCGSWLSLGCCCHFVHLGHRDSMGGDGIEGWAEIVY
jgi:hypothetical protein